MKKKIFLIVALFLLLCILGVLFFYTKKQKNYEIPIVYFEGDISEMSSKKDVRKIKIKYRSNEVNFESYAEIKIQGTSSLAYDKKNYNITLFGDDKYTNKYKVDLGYGSQSKYCLKANWIDKTHARNIVTARLASEINEKYGLFADTPNNGVIDGHPVEIYINGEFLGLYTWNIPKDAWMFNIDEENENHLVFANEGWTDSSLFKAEVNEEAFSIEAGIESEESYQKLEKLSKFLRNSSDKEFKENLHKYMNIDAVINYYILVEFALLEDNVAKNMLLVTYDGNLWYPVLYDLDSSWGTKYDGLDTLDYKKEVVFIDNMLWKKLDRIYAQEIAKRYFELRKDFLTKEHILDLFNEFKSSIPTETFEKENGRWDNIPGFDYKQIEEFLDVRIPFVDNIMKEILEH